MVAHRYFKLKLAALLMLTVTLMCAAFASAYGLMSFIFRDAGFPVGVWEHVISGLIGVTLFFAFSVPIHAIFHPIDGRKQLLDDAMNVFEKLSRGEFDVVMPSGYDYGPFDGLVESINKMARDLGSMEKMRQDFISDISHEIQSPLTSIQGFAALLKDDGLSPERRNHYIEIIETESGRMSSLSDNLLRLSALESNESPLSKNEYRLDRQIENIALTLEPQWRAKNLSMNAELEGLTLFADESLMSEVWINLLQNAVKFTPPGGEITITLHQEREEICCRISDNGVGIAPQDQMHVFERFYKTDKSRDRSLGGNGLGLSIARRIVELHGGRIELKSQLRAGTTFSVFIPR
jgi:signal transduction histidine kinase